MERGCLIFLNTRNKRNKKRGQKCWSACEGRVNHTRWITSRPENMMVLIKLGSVVVLPTLTNKSKGWDESQLARRNELQITNVSKAFKMTMHDGANNGLYKHTVNPQIMLLTGSCKLYHAKLCKGKPVYCMLNDRNKLSSSGMSLVTKALTFKTKALNTPNTKHWRKVCCMYKEKLIKSCSDLQWM